MPNHAKKITGVRPQSSTDQRRMLLTAGVVSGPLFYVVAIAQMFIRPGFDLRRHAISLLLLGDLGWIQIANFIISGLLIILGAVGLRQVMRGSKGGTWGPLLIGVFGAGAFIAGIFHPDPGLGFPPGAPAGMPTTMSANATLHALAFNVAFLALIIDCFVFVRAFLSRGQRGWAIYSAASGLLAPLFIVLGMSNLSMVGVLIAIAGAIAFGWVSVISARFLSEVTA